jgi:hypothetical protein
MNIQKIIMVGAAMCLTPFAALGEDGGSAGDGDRPITYTPLTFPDLDRNRDGAINQSEQRASYLDANLFKQIDVNTDKQVSEAEFDAFQATNMGTRLPARK